MQMNNEKNTVQIEGVLSQGYGLVPKMLMKDKRLSIGAKIVYCYISSFQTQLPLIEDIIIDLNITFDEYNKFSNELIKFGYSAGEYNE